jgi:hypothetical protein
MIGPRSPHEQRHEYPMPRNTAQRNSGAWYVTLTA